MNIMHMQCFAEPHSFQNMVIVYRRWFGVVVTAVVGFILWTLLHDCVIWVNDHPRSLLKPIEYFEPIFLEAPRANDKILLWWTSSYGDAISTLNKCGETNTFVSTDRRYINHPNLTAILFYGSNIDVTDLPLPRNPLVPWALLHEESPKNEAFLSRPNGIALFNWTSTFSRHSTFPLSPISLHSYSELLDNSFLVPLQLKNEIQSGHERLAPVVYMQSICNTMSGRDEYVQELMQFIDVDSYGHCLHNRDMPKHLTGEEYLSSLESPELYSFLARYKFAIAIENSVCDDYVTEKLWRTLSIGVVPIYFGAPNIRDWLPGQQSAILVSDFQGPRHLAAFLHYLNNDEEAYLKYTRTSDSNAMYNDFLSDAIKTREQRTHGATSVFTKFECSVAQRDPIKGTEVADESHYPCVKSALQYAALEDRWKVPQNHNNWQTIWRQAECVAKVIDDLVRVNMSYSRHEYLQMLEERYHSGICQI